MDANDYTELIWQVYPIKDITLNALGLCGEAGEFANKIKKRSYKVISNEDLLDELGDVLWHVAQCTKLLGSDLNTVMANSAKKCQDRNQTKY